MELNCLFLLFSGLKGMLSKKSSVPKTKNTIKILNFVLEGNI